MHIYVLGSKPLRWNFIKIFLLSIRSGAHKLFRRFSTFAIFNHNFAKIMAPPSNKNDNYLAPAKRAISSDCKLHQNRPINSDTKPVHNIPPRTNSAPASDRDKNKQSRNNIIISKAMQYRQDIVTCMPIMQVQLITISIVTIRSNWHNSAADFFAF